MPDQLESLRSALTATYDVERELGRGGMATVYLATDRKHERKVAIKVLRPELAESVGHERFLREVKTTAKLSHAHILPMLDSGETSGLLYYVMPFIEGESLRDRLQREKQLPVDVTMDIACSVASALTYAHSAGVIHRDIKPENILLSGGTAIVADFGIARAVTKAAGENLTSTGLAVGTPAYMSPEQSTGESDVDVRTDIYSLGTVIYEMLAGETPFTGPNPQAVIAKRLTLDVPTLTTFRDVPDSLDDAVHRSLARAPADRWPTMEAFGEALRLERATQSHPAQRRPSAAIASRTRAAASTRRRAWIAVASVLAVGAVVGVIALNNPDAQRGTSAPIVAPRDMRLVPGDTFQLFGGTCEACLPGRSVFIDSFYIDRTEVTVDEFRALASTKGLTIPPGMADSGRIPASGIMWPEASAYCAARDPGTRLPSELEWEAAARGREGREYPWGNTWLPRHANANNEASKPIAVATYAAGASPYQVFDMVGNVWEWTSTPATPDAAGRRRYIIRGGAFNADSSLATTTLRAPFAEMSGAPNQRENYRNTGFRCAWSAVRN